MRYLLWCEFMMCVVDDHPVDVFFDIKAGRAFMA